MANLQFPVTHHNGAVLGSEYCSGYIDILGKWNTGFYCPTSDSSSDVFCCGSQAHKYCCTRRDQVLQHHMQGLTVAIGVAVGASTAVLLLTIVSCVCCPWCPLNRRKPDSAKGSRPGSVYRLTSHDSALSGATQSYSLSAAGASSSSPVPPSIPGGILRKGSAPRLSHTLSHNTTLSHSNTLSHNTNLNHASTLGRTPGKSVSYSSHTLPHSLSRPLPHSLSHQHSFRQQQGEATQEVAVRQYGTLGRAGTRECPPPYHILPRASYLVIPQDTPDLLSDAAIHSQGGGVEDDEEEIYTSTKF